VSLNKFFSELQRNSVYHQNRFTAFIEGLDPLRIASISFSGFSLSTKDGVGVGIPFTIGVGLEQKDVEINVILSKDLREFNYLHQWKRGSQNAIVANQKASIVNYYDTYVKDVVIQAEDTTGAKTFAMKLINAYPISLSDVQLEWATTDSVAYATFTLRYQDSIIL
jgi:hypothetical protein